MHWLVGLVIKSKLCNCCTSFKRKYGDKEPMPLHDCWRNHSGTSGSMEPAGAVEVLVHAYEKHHVVIRRVCCDDDSSIRANCQWSNENYLMNYNKTELLMVAKTVGINKGELQPRLDDGKQPSHVPEPTFVADPNHRREGLKGELIKLDLSTAKEKMTMTQMDSTCIGKNFGYMAGTCTLKDKDPSEYVKSAKACLEHHFDNHEFGGNWCNRKLTSDEQNKKALIKYYRCKVKDANLYTLCTGEDGKVLYL
jgi:hypothetical protein